MTHYDSERDKTTGRNGSENELDPYRVLPSGIDADMKRLRWLCWRIEGETKPPKRAECPEHPKKKASSTDPSTWSSFEEVTEAAEGKDVGIGLSFEENEQPSPFVAIDIDIPEGGEWVPPLDRLGGAVVERSPSGNLRVYLRDVDVPTRWKNLGRDGRDQPELKLFWKSGYVTVTGDVLEGHGPPIGETSQVAFETWLKDAWRAFHQEVLNEDVEGETPPWEAEDDTGDVEDSESSEGDTEAEAREFTEWFGENEARDALSYIDPDAPYDKWRNVCYALRSRFDQATTERLWWDEWSQEGSKSNDEGAEEAAKKILKDAEPTGGRGIGTVIKYAQDGGWDPSVAFPEDVLKDREGDFDFDFGRAGQPDGFTERDGCYGYMKEVEDGKWVFKPWTSFTLEAVEFLRSGGDRQVTLRVVPAGNEEPYQVTVPMTVFNDARKFKDKVVTGFTTTFDVDYQKLDKLRAHVGQMNAPHRQTVGHIGLHESESEDEWVTPVGSIGPEGWIEDPEFAFVAAENDKWDEWALAPDDDLAEDGYDPETVARSLSLLPQTRDPERFLPILGWFYAAPFRPYIMEWEGEFNLLGVVGDTGAGKTAMIGECWRMFGMTDNPISAKSTSFSARTMLSTSNALPVWLDEYMPAEMDTRKVNGLHECLKTSTRGGTYLSGNKDQSLSGYRLKAPAVVSGEQPFSRGSEQRRAIMTALRKEPVAKGSETRARFLELEGIDHRHHAYALYQWITGLDVKEVKAAWESAHERVQRILEGMEEDPSLEKIEEQGLQTVVFGVSMWRRFAEREAFGVDTEAIIPEKVGGDSIRWLIDGNGTRSAGHSTHVGTLIGLIARAAYHTHTTRERETTQQGG